MSSYVPNEPSARVLPPEIPTEQLKAANYFLRTALDQMSEGVLILQPHGLQGLGPKILFGNARIASMVGADPIEGLRDRFVCQLVASQPEAEELLQAIRNSVKNGGVALWEGELARLRGARPLRAMWRIRAVQNQHGQVANFTVNVAPIENALGYDGETSRPHPDRSDGKPPVEDARRLRTENLAAMAKGIVHDINNLLGIISGHLSVAVTQTPIHTDVGQHVDEALGATHRARQFTDQILRLAKDLPAKREPTDLVTLVRETARVAQSGSGVLIHLNLARDLWCATVDSAQISQVLQNLVLNGIQAMRGAGHMDVVARNVEHFQPSGNLRPGRYVEISVRDRGCGISPENLQRIFHESFSTKQEGNGIGLTTCKCFIDAHQGEIRVSSMINIGTEFAIYLPAVEGRQAAPEPKTRQALISGSGTILVVDDEGSLRRISSAILKHCGYRVFEAASGEEAVRAYQQLRRSGNEVDMVVMDLTLRGGMDGEEAFREIRLIDPDAKVIASSGALVEETRRSYLAAGFVDILPKPYEASDLALAVHRALKVTRVSRPAPQPALNELEPFKPIFKIRLKDAAV